jgi:hypothetical protein
MNYRRLNGDVQTATSRILREIREFHPLFVRHEAELIGERETQRGQSEKKNGYAQNNERDLQRRQSFAGI